MSVLWSADDERTCGAGEVVGKDAAGGVAGWGLVSVLA